MKKIISLVTTLTTCTGILTPVMALQNNTVNDSFNTNLQDGKKTYQWYPKTSNKNIVNANAIYYTNTDNEGTSDSYAYYNVYLTPLGAKGMGLFTTHGPVKHHPENNFMWGLNTFAPAFGAHTNQAGDYLVGITDGMDNHLVRDPYIIEHFEAIHFGSVGSGIETYMNSKTTANLELSFKYIGKSTASDNSYYIDVSGTT